jgi:parvulin-like peptidyl-prolyl isomerase
MIQEMRNAIFKGQSSTQFIIALLVIALGAGAIDGIVQLFSLRNKDIVAYVQKEPVFQSEIIEKMVQYHTLVDAYTRYFGEFGKTIIKMQGLDNPDAFVWDRIKADKVLEACAYSTSLYPSARYCAEKLNDAQFVQEHLGHIIPFETRDSLGGIEVKKLATYLKRVGLSLDYLDAVVYKAVQRESVQEAIGCAMPFAGEQPYAGQDITRSYTIAFIDKKAVVDELMRSEKVSDDTLRAFYTKQNSESKKYWTEEKRSGTEWICTPEKFNISISDTMIERYYKQHIDEFTQQAEEIHARAIVVAQEALVQSLYAQTHKDPATFADIARTQSLDKKTASRGGDMGWVSRSDLTAQDVDQDTRLRLQKIFELESDGAVSQPFKTNRGYEIVGRVARKRAVYNPFESVKKAIIEKVKEQMFPQRFAQEAREILRNPDEKAFEAFLKKHGAQEKAIDSDPRLKEILKEGGKKWFKNGSILRLNRIEKSKEISFSTIKTQVKDDYIHDLADKNMREQEPELYKQFLQNPQAIGSVVGIRLMHVDAIKTDDTTRFNDLAKNGLPVDLLKRMYHVNQGTRSKAKDGQALLIRLNKLVTSAAKSSEQEKQVMHKPITRQDYMQFAQKVLAVLTSAARVSMVNSKGEGVDATALL